MKGLQNLPDKSVNCCVTSPPYFGLRDYGQPDQIGLEKTPKEFVAKLVQVFTEVRRVLKDDGTLWLNLGDSYAAGKKGREESEWTKRSGLSNPVNYLVNGNSGSAYRKPSPGYKPKDLIGIPWMVAFALRSAGWYLRQDIIWHKPNPMPESVTDRCTKSHEYIFLLSKSHKYYYDHEAIKVDAAPSSYDRLNQNIEQQTGSNRVPGKTNGAMKAVGGRKSGNKERKLATERGCPENGVSGSVPWEGMKANKRSVWTVTTKPFKEAHFATFPPDLIEPCIKAGCPEGGVVLDPFMGAGTTALVALRNSRHFTGFELNPEYIEIAERRLTKEFPNYKDSAFL